jgi:transposase
MMITEELAAKLESIERSQAAIAQMLSDLVAQKVVKDFYSVEDVAERVGRTPYQVREWLRDGRLTGEKRVTGRGRYKEWQVSHEELLRYQNHGLRPAARRSPA